MALGVVKPEEVWLGPGSRQLLGHCWSPVKMEWGRKGHVRMG